MNSPRTAKHVSHKQIAEILQISRATVSNVLSGREGIPYRKETREKIIKTARELGYQPNRASVALRKGRSNLIGVIHFGGGSGPSDTAMLLPKAIKGQGFDYLVLDFRWIGGDMKRMVSEMIQSRVEGVIISHMQGAFSLECIAMLEQMGIPAVTVYGSENLGIPLFCDDVPQVFQSLTEHLIDVGHRDLALVVYQNGSRTPRERMEGFTRGLAPYGKVEIVNCATYLNRAEQAPRPRGCGEPRGTVITLENARRVGDVLETSFQFGLEMFSSKPLPHALLASNDEAAFGYFHAAAKCGIRIPEDLALTGFDNALQSRYPLFNLTTAQTDVEAACESAAKALAGYIRGEQPSIQSAKFDSQLVLRGSCGRAFSKDKAEAIIHLPSPRPILQSVE